MLVRDPIVRPMWKWQCLVRGRERTTNSPLRLSQFDWEGWRLCCVRPDDKDLVNVEQPCFLVGLEIRHSASPLTHTLYVDSLAFFTERMTPLPMDLQRPLNVDVSATEESLPFPVDGLSVVPELDKDAVRTTVSELASDHYVLGSRSIAGVLEYHIVVTNQIPVGPTCL